MKTTLMKKITLCSGLMCALSLLTTTAFATAPATPYETLPTWSLVWTNAAETLGHLSTDADHGGWTLLVAKDTSRWNGRSLTIGYKAMYGQGSGVVSGGDSNGMLDLRGTITDATNGIWKIGAIEEYAFVANTGVGSPKATTPAYNVTGFYSPGTLTGTGLGAIHHDRTDPRPQWKFAYWVEPSVTKIPAWLFSGCKLLTNVVFRCPAVTVMGEQIGNGGSPIASCADEWDLSSLATISYRAMGGWSKVTGHLTLPSAATIANIAFQDMACTSVVLGVNGTLTSVNSFAFTGNALKNLLLGGSPSGKTLTLSTNAFACANLERVWLNGANPPVCNKAAGTYSFGTAATKEGQITFYVQDLPGFKEILAAADADPDHLVDASVFNTAQKVHVERFAGFVPAKEMNYTLFDSAFQDKYGERITITGSSSPFVGTAQYLCPITVTASCSSEPDASGRQATFHRWAGLPVAREKENPLVLASAEDIPTNIRAVFNHDWFYDTAANVISNGIWAINVYPVDAAKRTLKIGKQKANGTLSTAFTGIGNGVLDLNGIVRDADGQVWTLTATTAYCFTKLRAWDNDVDSTSTMATVLPTVVVFPETLTTLANSAFNFNQTRSWPLREVVCILPQFRGKVYFEMNGPQLLTKFLFRVPGATLISQNCFWQDFSFAETSFDDWDMSGVTEISMYAFGRGCTSATGTLRLPSLQTMGEGNFKNCSLEGVVLATNLTLTSIGTNCFFNCAALKSVTIGNAKAGLTIGETSFSGTTAPTNVTFLGRLNTAAADQVLSGVAASDGAKTAQLSASLQLGWNDARATMTDAETAVAPTGAWGVYRAGLRKAWMMQYASPFDPKGLIFLIH